MPYLDFDANTVDPTDKFEAIPQGRYLAEIVHSEHCLTRAGTGKLLKLRFQVIDGEHKGRVVFGNLNLEHAKEQVVAIARAELSRICRAVGVMHPVDSSELHRIPMLIDVTHSRGQDGRIHNAIRGYHSVADVEDSVKSADEPSPESTDAPWA